METSTKVRKVDANKVPAPKVDDKQTTGGTPKVDDNKTTSALLSAAVRGYTDSLRAIATATTARRIDNLIAADGVIADWADDLAAHIDAAKRNKAEIKRLAQVAPGACCTLYNGDEPMFNPLVVNPDNPRGANSWPPSQIWSMINRESVNIRKVSSVRTAK